MSLSCTKMDDYLKYVDGARRTYTGKLDTAYFNPGHNRMEFHGELSSDPKVTKIGIFWETVEGKQNMILDVDYKQDKSVSHIFMDMPEGSYNFTVYTYDAEGNSSIPTNVAGTSYGENYINGLYNRVVKSSEVIDGDIVIEWYGASEDSPYSEVTYTTADDEEKTVIVESNQDMTTLADAKNNIYSVRSYFRPEEKSIDVFKTNSAKTGHARADVTAMYLKNAGPNITAAVNNGEFGIPDDWKITDNIKNRENNTLGGWGSDDGGRIRFKTWGGGSQYENGKCWQTMTLPAGSYQFTTRYCRASTDWDKAVLHMVVAEGTELPDHDPQYYRIDNNSKWSKPAPDEEGLKNSLAYRRLQESDRNGDTDFSISFTLDEETTVSMGLVVTLNADGQDLDFSYFKLVQTN